MATVSDDKSPAATKIPSPPSQVPSTSITPSQSQSPNPDASTNAELQQIPQTRLPIKTYHCAFCNHLLLASTCDLSSLPRRREPARDKALILPLPKAGAGEEEEAEEEEDEEAESENESEAGVKNTNHNNHHTSTNSPEVKKKAKPESTPQLPLEQQHYTILLSTTIPDRKPTMIRREDGFEKRLLLRCGRCRVVMGYALDEVHFADHKFGAGARARGERGSGEAEKEDVEEGERERTRKKAEEVVYVLPGSLVETGDMGKGEIRVEAEEWAEWEKGKK
ncbi:hypothetical protein AJ78_01198 [Emergomyces pasteurianus Ep9510]|uniref:STEEP1 domain-containing protein n=1 Tax=Emergomyces pasteurianus Ep9510 TaxID=1447872 RepID=A0A1J9QRI2_9EURO|nr:hypothetical protein AJ78_01198 [Emergomyces pasteurianus Ep9510]